MPAAYDSRLARACFGGENLPLHSLLHAQAKMSVCLISTCTLPCFRGRAGRHVSHALVARNPVTSHSNNYHGLITVSLAPFFLPGAQEAGGGGRQMSLDAACGVKCNNVMRVFRF